MEPVRPLILAVEDGSVYQSNTLARVVLRIPPNQVDRKEEYGSHVPSLDVVVSS